MIPEEKAADKSVDKTEGGRLSEAARPESSKNDVAKHNDVPKNDAVKNEPPPKAETAKADAPRPADGPRTEGRPAGDGQARPRRNHAPQQGAPIAPQPQPAGAQPTHLSPRARSGRRTGHRIDNRSALNARSAPKLPRLRPLIPDEPAQHSTSSS